jgi:uncharacterized LabA/DUF88 family protein
MQSKAQRVGVFVDVQNMFYSAKHLYSRHVNFKSILKEAVAGRQLIRAIAYVIKTEEMKNSSFFDALEMMGYEVKAKELQIFPGGAKKGDWDIGIAMDMIELGPRLDTLILVSGDGDYVDLLEHLKRAVGCRVEVIAFGKSTSSKLRTACDSFIDLSTNTKKFLMAKKR